MFEAFGDHAKRQRLHAGNRLVAVNAVAHDASQARHLSQPAAVVFALDLDRKDHVGTVPSGRLSNKRMEPTRQLFCATRRSGARLISSVRRMKSNDRGEE